MKIRQIGSHDEFLAELKGGGRVFLLLYKSGSEQSDCAYKSLADSKTEGELVVVAADVALVRDIHPHYGITTVPSLLEFEDGRFRNVVKGCNGPEFYTSYFENIMFSAVAEGSTQKRVTVYTTPSCSWCTTLKSHLRKNGVRFDEVDVASDSAAAEEMTRKSGQRGVPQTDIDGEMIVGFDKAALNRLLNIG